MRLSFPERRWVGALYCLCIAWDLHLGMKVSEVRTLFIKGFLGREWALEGGLRQATVWTLNWTWWPWTVLAIHVVGLIVWPVVRSRLTCWHLLIMGLGLFLQSLFLLVGWMGVVYVIACPERLIS